jgi:hypothetical protein
LHEGEQQCERRQHDEDGDRKKDEQASQSRVRSCSSGDGELLRQQIRMLRDAPRPDHGADRARGERTRAATGAAAEQDEHCGAADERENDDRQRVSGEPIEPEPSIVA